MKFRLRMILVAALLVVSFASPSQAQFFGGRVFIGRREPYPYRYQDGYAQSAGGYSPYQAGWHAGPRRAPTHAETVRYMNYYYPKYYGGFHANYFQAEALPPGDIGLRGNGIFQTPW